MPESATTTVVGADAAARSSATATRPKSPGQDIAAQVEKDVHPTITLWGLTPRQLHDAYWIARGVQCIRQGEHVELDHTADLYLLLQPRQLVLFDLRSMIERLVWRGSHVTRLRVMIDPGTDHAYRERIQLDEQGCVQRIERLYEHGPTQSQRIILVQRAKVADLWMNASSPRSGWKAVRRSVPQSRVDRFSQIGHCFTAGNEASESVLLDELVRQWSEPQSSIQGIRQAMPCIWMADGDPNPQQATLVGPVWFGKGAAPEGEDCIVGPVWKADDPNHIEELDRQARIVNIFDVESPDERSRLPRHERPGWYPSAKRLFDVAFSSAVLIAASPILLAIALAIRLETGAPILFAHTRQSKGGKSFGCLKFRTMHMNAEKLVEQLRELNQCDGPQVNIKDDPRITRVGRVLRKFHLDELPQFWNVLKGEMSIVGPRPSPEAENQFCPAWRELRLSVRPGITGLWQLKRTRLPGQDFQEWIRYDIEYVRQASFALDMAICLQTARIMLFGRKSDD